MGPNPLARPKTEYPPADVIRALADGEGRLALRVSPGARSEGLSVEQGRVTVKVRAKPQDGAATDAVLRMVAEALGIAPSRVALVRGATSRDKLVRIPLD